MNTLLQNNLLKLTERADDNYQRAHAARAIASDALFELQARQVDTPTPETKAAMSEQLQILAKAEDQVTKAYAGVLDAQSQVDKAKIRYGLI